MSSLERSPDRIAAWGLQQTVAGAGSAGFWPITGRFLWLGIAQSRMVISDRRPEAKSHSQW